MPSERCNPITLDVGKFAKDNKSRKISKQVVFNVKKNTSNAIFNCISGGLAP
jgi:hypothetical protein